MINLSNLGDIQRRINGLLRVFLFVLAMIFLGLGFKEKVAEVFKDFSFVIIQTDVVLLVTFAINRFRIKITRTEENIKKTLKEKIEESIKIEKDTSFGNIKEKIREYESRADLYSFFLERLKFNSLIKIFLSIIFAVCYIVLYGVLISNYEFIKGWSISWIWVVLIVFFFCSLYHFLTSILHIIESLSKKL